MPFSIPVRPLLYGVIFLNSISLSVVFPSLYGFASELGVSPGWAAFYFASYGVAQFLAAPVLGRLADSLGRRPILLICVVGTAIASFVQAFVTVPAVLIVARLADGVTGGNNSVADAALADSANETERYAVFANSNAAFGAGFLAGPLLNWWLVGYGLQVPFLGAAALATLGSVLIYLYLPETLPPAQRRPVALFPELRRVLYNLYEGLRRPLLGILFAYMFVYAMAAGSFYFTIQPYVLDVLEDSQTLINLISTLFGASNLLVFKILPWLRSRFGVMRILIFLSFWRILIFALLPGSYLVFVTCACLICFINAFTRPILTALVANLSDPSKQGQNIGTLGSFFGAGFSLGPILAGLLIEATAAVSLPFYFAAALTVLVTGFLLAKAGRIQKGLST